MSELFQKLTAEFPPEALEWRILNAGLGSNGPYATLAQYVDARAVQKRLDEVLGPHCWQVHYTRSSDRGFICQLSLKIGEEWVCKEDGAEDTDMEPFKGGISGAFKRAASVWGIGRYLYDRPTEWAEFVDQGTRDARKVKIDNKFFWWVPPHHAPKAPSAPQVSPQKSISIPSKPTQATTPQDVGDYVVKVGKKYKDFRLRDMTLEDIQSFSNWLKRDSQEKGKPLSKDAQEFVTNGAAYVAKFQAVLPSPSEDDIPF